ncbi:hypothetical protein KAR91_71925 [Candidatus Pacearchaeota archaeon]|nr:hypothetical protein [Candidatus Pacearchaeota archaeon]
MSIWTFVSELVSAVTEFLDDAAEGKKPDIFDLLFKLVPLVRDLLTSETESARAEIPDGAKTEIAELKTINATLQHEIDNMKT